MSKINLKYVSTNDLFAPFVLTREFGMDPKIVLNPAFDKTLSALFHHHDKQNQSMFHVSEENNEYSVISSGFSNSACQSHCNAFFKKDGTEVQLEYYYRHLSKLMGDSIDFKRRNITLGEGDTLVTDSADVILSEDQKNKSARLWTQRNLYDKYGILDFIRSIVAVPGKIEFGKVSKVKHEELMELVAKYMNFLGLDLNTLLSSETIGCHSHEITRHPDIIDKANLSEIVESNGKRRIVTHLAPLYNVNRRINNLYGMDYNYIVGCLEPLRTYSNCDEAMLDRLRSDEELQRKLYSRLSRETLTRIITDENAFQAPVTVAAMKTRAGKRLVLSKDK